MQTPSLTQNPTSTYSYQTLLCLLSHKRSFKVILWRRRSISILSKQTSNQITLLCTHFTLPFIFTLLLLILLFPLLNLSFHNLSLLIRRPYILTTHPLSTSYLSSESWQVSSIFRPRTRYSILTLSVLQAGTKWI